MAIHGERGGSTVLATPAGWRGWYERHRQAFEREFSAHLKRVESRIGPHSPLGDAVQYSMALTGKRFRPVLVLGCCEVCGRPAEDGIVAAIAVECIHTFSLIHDDLPAMDDDELRRGQPCNHRVFGEAQALLAGDWLATYPFGLLAESYPGAQAARLVRALATGTLGMIAGQGADVAGEERPTDGVLVDYIHEHKTARLIEAACRLGAICGEANEAQLDALGRYGRHLGLAFQITDDLLDVTSTTEKMGKRVGKDSAAAKQTYPAAYGVEASRARAREEVSAATDALASFESAADQLRDLARYVITRDH